MDQHAAKLTRHGLLRRQMGLAVLGVVGCPRQGEAAKLQKADVAYQDRPKDGKHCATCRAFTLISASTGSCAIVDGAVSANGWCTAYSALQPLAR